MPCMRWKCARPARRLHTADDAAAPGPAVPAPPPATDARLSALIVQDAAGNVFDLSSPFIPGVMQYAAMVPDNVTSVTLCVSPSQGENSRCCFMALQNVSGCAVAIGALQRRTLVDANRQSCQRNACTC